MSVTACQPTTLTVGFNTTFTAGHVSVVVLKISPICQFFVWFTDAEHLRPVFADPVA